jgi:hypothetical protein
MNNLTFGIPVKTRLPRKAWMLATVVTLFSLASSIGQMHSTPRHAIYAGATAEQQAPRGS